MTAKTIFRGVVWIIVLLFVVCLLLAALLTSTRIRGDLFPPRSAACGQHNLPAGAQERRRDFVSVAMADTVRSAASNTPADIGPRCRPAVNFQRRA